MLLCPFAYLAVDNNYTSILGVGVFKTKIILRTKISYILSSRSPCQIIYIYIRCNANVCIEDSMVRVPTRKLFWRYNHLNYFGLLNASIVRVIPSPLTMTIIPQKDSTYVLLPLQLYTCTIRLTPTFSHTSQHFHNKSPSKPSYVYNTSTIRVSHVLSRWQYFHNKNHPMTSYPHNINSPRGLSPLQYFHSS